MLYKHVLYLGLFLIIQKELPSSWHDSKIAGSKSPASILVNSIPQQHSQHHHHHQHHSWNPVQIPFAPSLHFTSHLHHQHHRHPQDHHDHLSSPLRSLPASSLEHESTALAPLVTNSRFDLAYDQTYEYDNSLPFDARDEDVIHPVLPPDEPQITERTQPDTSATLWDKFTGNIMQIIPPAVRITSRYNSNQGCVGGTKCQFFLVCWMGGGSLGSSCGPLYTCCVTPSSQEIQPAFYGPVSNDPYCGRSSTRISRIVGGSDASFGQFPWQAFVQVGGSRCGGALVGPKHVVTAGHCVARSQHNPTSIRVTLGDYILHSDIESLPHEVFTVAEVRLHPNFRFTPQADRFDVAVLILDRNAHYQDNIKPICLPQKDASFLGRTSYVAGWGALQAGSKLRPKVLQHVAVPVIENAVCETWHRKRGINIRIHEEMMCAGHEFGGRDACQGDSGGPLMLNDYGVWYLIGIVSAGYSCAKQYQPGIYHRVSSSSDWISANVQSSSRR